MRAARCPGSEQWGTLPARGPRGRLLAPPRHGPPATWGQRPRRSGQRGAPPEQPGRAGPQAPGRSRPHPHPPRARTGFRTAAFAGNCGTGRPQRWRGPCQGDRRRGFGFRFYSFRVGSLASSPPPPRGHFLRNRDPLKWPRPSSQLPGLGRAGLSPKVTSLSRADGPSVLGPPLSSRPLPGVVPALPGGPSVVALGSATVSLLPPPAVPLT